MDGLIDMFLLKFKCIDKTSSLLLLKCSFLIYFYLLDENVDEERISYEYLIIDAYLI